MRTKTLFLAAAALAAGIASSVAQSNVYSVNVVGYVNTTFMPAGSYTLAANPLDNGTNDLVSLLDASLPNKSQVLAWDAGSQSFIISTKTAGLWTTNVALPTGAGFFVKTPTAQATPITNTFVGDVLIGFGATNTVDLPAAYVLSGSPVPFGGALNDAGPNSINLGATLPNKSQVLKWDTSSQAFIIATKTAGNWTTNINMNVGEGFFIKSYSATPWSQTLQ